jgi:hypothetical protein
MLSTGWNGGKPDALTAFNNVGRAYLAFARAEPAYYAAMFESGLPPTSIRSCALPAIAPLPCCVPLPTRWSPCCHPASGRRR